MAARHTANRRELAHRSSDGIDVYLFWNPATNGLVVDVSEVSGRSFQLAAAPDNALDVFTHPFAYARLRADVTSVARMSPS